MSDGSLFKNRGVSLILGLVAMFFWGSLFPVVKLGYRAFGVDTGSVGSILLFAGIRFVLCGGIFLAVIHRRGGLKVPRGRTLSAVTGVALFAYFLHYMCTYVGIARLDSSKTAIIKQVGSLFIVCFAFLFRREDSFSPRKLIGGLLGFLSILVINMNGLRLSFNVYDLLVIAASFASVAAVVISKNAYDTMDPLSVTGWAQLLGGAALTAAGLLLGGWLTRFGPDAALIMLYMCFASCAGYGLWNMLLKYNDMSRLNTIKFAETLFGVFCAWLLLGEDIFRPIYLVSLLLLCAGIVIGTGRPARPRA